MVRPTDDGHPSILFLGRESHGQTAAALQFCRANSTRVTACLGQWGDPLPEQARSWEGDYVVSYLSRWVVPEPLLSRARIAAINFHPGPPEYPGVGCINFALYENAQEYGTTCHYMAPAVDTGPIIAVSRFPILPTDNVASLFSRVHTVQLALFYEVMSIIFLGKPLPRSADTWTRRPFTRRQLNDLGRITPQMSSMEIARRVRATAFEKWKPAIEIAGFRFALEDGETRSE